MSLPRKLDHCPRTPECMAKAVWIDDDTGSLFRMDGKHQAFVPHLCTVRGSEKPKMVYLAEWYNTRTQRTRWVGPARMRSSVEKPPGDGIVRRPSRSQSADPQWVLRDTYVMEGDWCRLDK
jgi:hypothetical protein